MTHLQKSVVRGIDRRAGGISDPEVREQDDEIGSAARDSDGVIRNGFGRRVRQGCPLPERQRRTHVDAVSGRNRSILFRRPAGMAAAALGDVGDRPAHVLLNCACGVPRVGPDRRFRRREQNRQRDDRRNPGAEALHAAGTRMKRTGGMPPTRRPSRLRRAARTPQAPPDAATASSHDAAAACLRRARECRRRRSRCRAARSACSAAA